MNYRLYGVIVLIMISNMTFSQNDSTHIAHNILYIELAGVGGYGSINYERVVFFKNKMMFGMRCGISSYHINDYSNTFNPDIVIPLSINAYYGKNHKAEIGVGETISNIVHADFANFKPKRETKFHTIFSIGYRYQKNAGGIFFRCTYTPIFEFNKYLRHWAGISFGFSF